MLQFFSSIRVADWALLDFMNCRSLLQDLSKDRVSDISIWNHGIHTACKEIGLANTLGPFH